jgi:hypothetical protein
MFLSSHAITSAIRYKETWPIFARGGMSGTLNGELLVYDSEDDSPQ